VINTGEGVVYAQQQLFFAINLVAESFCVFSQWKNKTVLFVGTGLDFHQISYKTNTTGMGSYTVSLPVFAATKSNHLSDEYLKTKY